MSPNRSLPLPVSRRGPHYNLSRLLQSNRTSQPVSAQASVYALASPIRTSLSALAHPKACVNARTHKARPISIEPNQESSRPHPRYAQRSPIASEQSTIDDRNTIVIKRKPFGTHTRGEMDNRGLLLRDCCVVQLLNELEHSSDMHLPEESARLLGILIRSCSRLVLPYVSPILKALMTKLRAASEMAG